MRAGPTIVTFNSLVFAGFFVMVVAAYWNVPGRWKNHLLTVASYGFYAWWDWRLLALLIAVTLVGYRVGLALDGTVQRNRRRVLLAGSVVVNLGVLAAFKYLDFFVDEMGQAVEGLGLSSDAPTLDILLPIGVSFYTLQTLGYTIDVARGRVRAETHLATFASFVAFFPQLVAGPIERADGLLPQLRGRRRRLRYEDVEAGFTLIVLGLFKKVVLADGVARVVDGLWANPGQASTTAALAGLIGFTVQIYADFSGYSNMARGLARLLGIDLTVNFAQPYLAPDIRRFWRRWHISFHTWMRDYVYIPLGGNRRGRRRTVINLLVTMVIAGAWHGAGWMFLLWGLLHGLWLVAARGVDRLTGPRPVVPPLIGVAFTHLGVTLLWILFRSPDAGVAMDVGRALVGAGGSAGDPADLGLVIVAWLTMMVVDVLDRRRTISGEQFDRRPTLSGAALGLTIVAIVVFAGTTPIPFLYYQF